MKSVKKADELFGMDLGVFVDGKPEETKKNDLTDEELAAVLDVLRKPCEMETIRREWLIKNLVMKGTLWLLSGGESKGKSTMTCQMCVDLANGKPTFFDDLDNWQGRDPMKVLYIDGEDQEEADERFQKLKCNENVYVFERKDSVIQLTTESPLLRNTVRYLKPGLVVLSPISAFLPTGCNPMKKKDVYRALRPLMDMAREFNCVFLIIQHTNKTPSPEYRKCISDSSYYSEGPRTITMMGETQVKGEFFCSLEKGSNTSVYEPFLTRVFRMQREKQEMEVAYLTKKKWRDFVLEAQGKDVAAFNIAASRAQNKSQKDECRRLILQVLREHDGALERDVLISETTALGASSGMWERAKKDLIDSGVMVADTVWNGKIKATTYRLTDDGDSPIPMEGGSE